MAVMDQAIGDGAGRRQIFQIDMPLFHQELAGDERGATIVAIIEDLQEVAAESGPATETEVNLNGTQNVPRS